MNRPKVDFQPIYVRSEAQIALAVARVKSLPIDPDHPVEVLIREQVKKRKITLNQAMWAGPLHDIEKQAWVNGRQFRAEIWHEHFKERFLPDPDWENFDPTHVIEGYRKWDLDPWKGNRILVGSTTQLTDRGMKVYLLQIEAEAATEYGVQFTDRQEPMGRIA